MIKLNKRHGRAEGRLVSGLWVLCMVVVMAGCVDHRYDLSKELDLTVGIGGDALAVPVGQTEKISMKKLLGKKGGDQLVVKPDGSYAITRQNSVFMRAPRIAPITFHPEPVTLSDMFPDFSRAVIPPAGAVLPVEALPVADISSRGGMQISAAIPSEVKAVSRATFVDKVWTTIRFEVVGAEQVARRMRFENLKITFPPYIVLASGGHELTLNDEFAVADGYERSVEIAALAFVPPLETDGSVVLDDEVILAGDLRITELIFPVGTLSGITLKPVLSVNDMEVRLVEGRVEPQLPNVTHELLLNDIPSFMNNRATVLDVDPYIDVEVSNPLGMEVDLDLTLTPVTDRLPNVGGMSNVRLGAAGAQVPGTPNLTRYRISRVKEGILDGYTFANAPNLPALVRTIPDAVDLGVKPALVPGSMQRVDLTVAEYRIQLDYELCIPMSFGPELAIRYPDTLKNIQKELKGFVDKVDEVRILTEIDNTIPLELEVAPTAVGTDMKPLAGVEVSAPQKIAPGTGSSVPVTSKYDVVIRETVAGALSRLDGLILEIRGGNNAVSAGVPITEKQFVQMKMKLRAPGGLTVDLNDL